MLSRFIYSETVDAADVDWRGKLAGIGIGSYMHIWKPGPER